MSATQPKQPPVNTTIFNCPGFQSLPKTIKQALVLTEARLFDLPISRQFEQTNEPSDATDCVLEIFMTKWRDLLFSRQSDLTANGALNA